MLASSALHLILLSPTDQVCCFPRQSANLILFRPICSHIDIPLFPTTAPPNVFAFVSFPPLCNTPLAPSQPPCLLTPLPGARFGPRAIRAASARQISHRGFNTRAGINPFTSWPHILDCGDIPITPFDNALALRQMTEAYLELLSRRPLSYSNPISHVHPKLITLGGDHSIALPALRALQKTYRQPIAVLHFDAHMVSNLVFHPLRIRL